MCPLLLSLAIILKWTTGSYFNIYVPTNYSKVTTTHVSYCSPNTVRVIKWRRMRWAGHVARMGEERGMYRVLLGETGGKETTGEI